MKLLNAFILNILLIGGLTVNSCNQARAAELSNKSKAKKIVQPVQKKTALLQKGFLQTGFSTDPNYIK